MKKILLLTVHPDENSLSHQFANIALDELKNKYDVEKINLYQDKEGDFWYLTFWADKIPTNDPELRAWREKKVKETDKFVVFFPIWFNDAPSKFKSWYENVFTAKFAYRYTKKGPEPLLKGKKFEFIATCDGPGFLYRRLPTPIRVSRWIRFYLPGIKLEKVTIFDHIRKRRKQKKLMEALFEQVRKLVKKI